MLLDLPKLQITTPLHDLANMWKFSMESTKKFKELKFELIYLKKDVSFKVCLQSPTSQSSIWQLVETRILILNLLTSTLCKDKIEASNNTKKNTKNLKNACTNFLTKISLTPYSKFLNQYFWSEIFSLTLISKMANRSLFLTTQFLFSTIFPSYFN